MMDGYIEAADSLLTPQGGHHEGADEPRLRPRTSGRVEIISGAYRRKRWTPQDKARITAESYEPGARVADVARRHDVSEGLLHQWRQKAREAVGGPMFVPVRLDSDSSPKSLIEIEFPGATVRVKGAVDAALLRTVLAAFRPRG